MTAKREMHPKLKATKPRREPSTAPASTRSKRGSAPVDFARWACLNVASYLAGEMKGIAPWGGDAWSRERDLCVAILRDVAEGRDPRELIDGRKKDRSRAWEMVSAVYQVMHAPGVYSWKDAYARAAMALGIKSEDTTEIERAWLAHKRTPEGAANIASTFQGWKAKRDRERLTKGRTNKGK